MASSSPADAGSVSGSRSTSTSVSRRHSSATTCSELADVGDISEVRPGATMHGVAGDSFLDNSAAEEESSPPAPVDSGSAGRGSPAAERTPTPRLEITPYPGPESEDELGPLCPTCKGRGEVDRDDEEGTIALIPMSDKRLKPRKTKLYTAIASVASLIACTLVVYFLFERTVSVQIESAYVVDYNVSIPNSVDMTVVMEVSVSNQNYAAVTIKNLTISISAPEDIGTCVYAGQQDEGFTASGQTTTKFRCNTVVTFVEDHAALIQEACEQSWAWNNFILLLTTKVNYSYLIFGGNTLEHVDWDCFTCRRGQFPQHQIKHSCYNRTHPHAGMVPIEPALPVTSS
eukprot:scpid53757/ scgid28304/ Transmembrane protein 106B